MSVIAASVIAGWAWDAHAIRLLGTSFLLCASVAIVTGAIGIPLALLLGRSNVPGRSLFLSLFAVQLFTPVYLQAAAWKSVFAWAGSFPVMAGWTSGSGFGWWATVWIHCMAALPWVILIVSAGLSSIEPELEEFALLNVSAHKVLSIVTLRRALPFVVAAMFWTMLTVFTDLTVTDLYSIRTYAEQIYLMYALGDESWFSGNEGLVGFISVSVAAVAVLLIMSAVGTNGVVGSWRTPRDFELTRGRWTFSLMTGLVIVGCLGIPMVSMIRELGLHSSVEQLAGQTESVPTGINVPTEGTQTGVSPRTGNSTLTGNNVLTGSTVRSRKWTVEHAANVLSTVMDESVDELRTSILMSVLSATGVCLVAGLIAWSARGGGWFSLAAHVVIAASLVIPGPVLGSLLVNVFSQTQFEWVAYLYDRTWLAPCLALMVRSWPLVGMIMLAAIRGISQEQLDLARTDGVGWLGQLIYIVIPQSWRMVFGAWLVAVCIAYGDLAATILVIPPGEFTVPLRVFGLLHAGVTDKVAALCLITWVSCFLLNLCAWRCFASGAQASSVRRIVPAG